MNKEELIRKLVIEGYIRRREVEEVFRKVPREEFVPEELRPMAYEDRPLPIGEGQTISAPHMVAYMVEAANISRGDKVLEVGTGSGYHAAIMAELVGPEGHVYTVERIRSLAEKAAERLARLGYSDRVTVYLGDGSKGLPEHAPFDKIIVTAAAKEIPKELIEQLGEGGIMVIPVEEAPGYQVLYRITKSRGGKLKVEKLLPVMFVPLVIDNHQT